MIDPQQFRAVLGNYPTGVCVITATDEGGDHHALLVGSFTSISLDPPLVGFFPAISSSTWPKIAAIGSFCVNVLGSDQNHICETMASNGQSRFNGVEHHAGTNGHPVLSGGQAWLECSVDRVLEIGDHYLVVGAVKDFGSSQAGGPMIFHRRGYHRIATT